MLQILARSSLTKAIALADLYTIQNTLLIRKIS